MFAYCLAAAHLELPHQTAASFMVSSVSAPGEGWKYIDNIPDESICQPDTISHEDLPNVLHFCQRYGWGPYFFGKRKLPHSFLSCDSPLLKVPPATLLKEYTNASFPGGNSKAFDAKAAKRNVFTVCYMIKTLNDAATYYKEHHCDATTVNKEPKLVLSLGK